MNVFSDFRHGLFNRDNIKYLFNSLPNKSFKVADSIKVDGVIFVNLKILI